MISITVNGRQQQFEGDGAMPLLWYLRDELGLTGTKFGCGIAACGACTVHVDGAPVRACVTPVNAAAGKRVTTIEGRDFLGTIAAGGLVLAVSALGCRRADEDATGASGEPGAPKNPTASFLP